jgi:hypothetical protein
VADEARAYLRDQKSWLPAVSESRQAHREAGWPGSTEAEPGRTEQLPWYYGLVIETSVDPIVVDPSL